MDKKHASLSAQAAQLQRSIQSREQRRIAEKAQRYEAAEAAGEYGGYDAPSAKRAAVGGGPTRNAAVSKLSEISALASRPAEVFRCELCNANFPSQAQHAQHLAGPVHRKALDKLAEQQLVAQRRAVYQDMTESALGAAAWAAGHGGPAAGGGGGSRQHGPPGPAGSAAAVAAPGGRGSFAGRGGGRGQGGAGRGPASGGPAPGAGPAGPRTDVLSHEEVVAAMTRADEPLTIGGWAPPSITLPAPKPSPPAAAVPAAKPKAAEPVVAGLPSAVASSPPHRDKALQGGPDPKRPAADSPGRGGDHTAGSKRAAEPQRNKGDGGGGGGGGGGLLGLAYGSDDEDEQEPPQDAEEKGRLQGRGGDDGPGAGSSSDDDEAEEEEQGDAAPGFVGSFF